MNRAQHKAQIRSAGAAVGLLRRRSMPLMIFVLIVSASAGVAIARTIANRHTVTYRAVVTSNPAPGPCYSKTAIYAGLQASLSKRLRRSDLRQLATANRPAHVTLTLNRRTYALAIDEKSSAYGNKQIGWTFRPVRINAAEARRDIGKHAKIKFRIHGRWATANTSKVQDGRCKSLI